MHFTRTGLDPVHRQVALHELVGVDRRSQSPDQTDEADRAADTQRTQRQVQVLAAGCLQDTVHAAAVGPVQDARVCPRVVAAAFGFLLGRVSGFGCPVRVRATGSWSGRRWSAPVSGLVRFWGWLAGQDEKVATGQGVVDLVGQLGVGTSVSDVTVGVVDLPTGAPLGGVQREGSGMVAPGRGSHVVAVRVGGCGRLGRGQGDMTTPSTTGTDQPPDPTVRVRADPVADVPAGESMLGGDGSEQACTTGARRGRCGVAVLSQSRRVLTPLARDLDGNDGP